MAQAKKWPDQMVWWKSRVLIGALVSVAFKVAFLTGLAEAAAPPDIAEWVDVALILSSFVGDAIAARARLVQEAAPPLTLSSKGAPL